MCFSWLLWFSYVFCRLDRKKILHVPFYTPLLEPTCPSTYQSPPQFYPPALLSPCLPVCLLPIFLPTYLTSSTFLSICLPILYLPCLPIPSTLLRIYLSSSPPAYLSTCYLPTYLPTSSPTYLLTYLPVAF